MAPYYPDKNNFIINGTQLLNGHGQNTIVLSNFSKYDFQFKTGICNSGYKIYQDTTDDADWKCILIESQINTGTLEPKKVDEKDKHKHKRRKKDAVTWQEREKERDQLSNHDIKRMFEYQFNVVFNMVPFDPL